MVSCSFDAQPKSKIPKPSSLAKITLVRTDNASKTSTEIMSYGEALRLSKRLNKELVPFEDSRGNINPGEYTIVEKSDDDSQSNTQPKAKKAKTATFKSRMSQSHIDDKIHQMNEWLGDGLSVAVTIKRGKRGGGGPEVCEVCLICCISFDKN